MLKHRSDIRTQSEKSKQKRPRFENEEFEKIVKSGKMAFAAFLSKASCETEYQSPSFSAEESVFEPLKKVENSQNTFEEILALKQKANKLRVQIEELTLKNVWQDNLNSSETIQSLESIDTQLQAVLDSKSTCLNILRNPKSSTGNSLSLSLNSQSQLSEAFDTLGNIVKSKSEHQANSSWIANQDWQSSLDLAKLNTQLLRLEANLAKNLQDINAINKI